MKFLGLKIFIAILELIAFLLIVPCLIVIGWALFGGEHPLNGQSLTQAATAVAVVGGVLLIGIVVAAIASVLNVLLAIERNTSNAAENAARTAENTSGPLRVLVVAKKPAGLPVEDETGQPQQPNDGSSLNRFLKRLGYEAQVNWRLAAAILAGVVLVVILVEVFSSPRRTSERIREVEGENLLRSRAHATTGNSLPLIWKPILTIHLRTRRLRAESGRRSSG